MDIYLVPIGRDGYELYCEVDEHASPGPVDGARGFRRRVSGYFRQGLAYLERERQTRLDRRATEIPRTRMQRIRDRVLGWLAERVAEQRLLWHLRSQHAATAHHPDDLSGPQASAIVTTSLRRDARRHAVWMVVDFVGYLAALPLTAIPGPNLLALYFAFRTAGHVLSLVGARHGLAKVRWAYAPCPPLTELRSARALPECAWEAVARSVASRLRLAHLERFVERLAAARP